MEILDRTLIGLRLVLEQFGIVVATPLMVKSDPPNMDLICAVVALVQLVHPLGYDFKLICDEGRYKVRSDNLAEHIVFLRKKSTRGDFIVHGRRYGIRPSTTATLKKITKYIQPPEGVPFTPTEWLFLVGMYAALNQCVSDRTIVEIVMTNYIEFMPFLDWAEEAVTMIRSQSPRNVL